MVEDGLRLNPHQVKPGIEVNRERDFCLPAQRRGLRWRFVEKCRQSLCKRRHNGMITLNGATQDDMNILRPPGQRDAGQLQEVSFNIRLLILVGSSTFRVTNHGIRPP